MSCHAARRTTRPLAAGAGLSLRSGLRRRALAGLLGGIALPRPGFATTREPAELLVPSPTGSQTDRWARGVAPFLERAWPRQALSVRNHPGQGGLQAVEELATSDRRIIGVLTTPLLLSRAVETAAPSPFARIAALAALVEEPVVLVGAPGGGTELDSLRTTASGAPPGAPIGTPPPGTGAHVTALRIAARLGRPVLAFPSAAAARQAAAAGHVAAAALTVPDAIDHLRENRLVAFGIAARDRSALLPDLPTLREAGLELLGATRRGFALAPDAPAAWRGWLLAGLETLATDPDFAAHCAEYGRVPRFLGPDAWGTLLARQEEELRRHWRAEPWLLQRT
ncbi:MAG TPA: tripartite tricarboxylate transporter substrate-binding protein [Falsiroseomonas sp.]|jgi:tripartite-type tricarboxylate transporter receptor subunit TctC|nr:tripartite tricarboxylate transporter substrate-binding protein [Falsiroseomonas sp.]